MNNKKRKRVGKREIVHVMSLYLKDKNMNMSKEKILIPVVNAFIFAVNLFLKNDIEINLRGFGNFLIKDIKRKKWIVGGKEYPNEKKRRVVFKNLNPDFS